MATIRNIKLARVVKVLLDLIFGTLVIAMGLLIIWIFISPLLLERFDVPGTASLPVAIGSDSQFDVNFSNSPQNEIRNAYVEEAQGILRIETTSWIIVFFSNAAQLLTGIGIAIVVNLLRLFIKDTLNGEPFKPENGNRIRKIGYLVLAMGFLRPFTEYVAANEILNRLPVAHPIVSPPSPFKVEMILVSLLILVLAQVWSYGWELERDRALTI
jgi:hypothetical protein